MKLDLLKNDACPALWHDREFEGSLFDEGRILSSQGAATLDKLLGTLGYFQIQILPEIERRQSSDNSQSEITSGNILVKGTPKSITLSRDPKSGNIIFVENSIATNHEAASEAVTYIVTTYSLSPFIKQAQNDSGPAKTYRISCGTVHMQCEGRIAADSNYRHQQLDFQHQALTSKKELSAERIEGFLKHCNQSVLKQAS